jgi:hypothetical protein
MCPDLPTLEERKQMDYCSNVQLHLNVNAGGVDPSTADAANAVPHLCHLHFKQTSTK